MKQRISRLRRSRRCSHLSGQSNCSLVVCLTLGNGGTRAQALGLAEALESRFGSTIQERRIVIKSWSKRLPARTWHWASRNLFGWPEIGIMNGASAMAPIASRGTRIIIGAGRHVAPLVSALASRLQGKSIAVLNPELPFDNFDIVVLPEHDGLSGSNVLTALGSLGRVTPKRIEREALLQAARFAHLTQPKLAVLIGGRSREFTWTDLDEARLLAACAKLVAGGWTLLVTPSPRTDPILMDRLRASVDPKRCWVWDLLGPNPYPAILGLAEAVLVTEDSVNMVSEASSSGLPVHVFRVSGRHPKMAKFYCAMQARSAVREFDGMIEHWYYAPLSETDRLAEIIGLRLLTH
ncbi:mitochondrial fission ELM1 family protein [Parasedimentitalea psychrophila]|uniref:Mitochondrial fission ELM1 family protein n=2 Tax=Parasedimentitalea psychrophila TaxID=2997337 RepID=A0A9Y2KXG1_9RHOB|nr:mitochondrial fission ELM1 family protein [Parasedimentitalea psychrophila]WIY24323.1 mitochondrial fission ELM1 family protein [Parasedimentitalea psychrophila]